MFCVVDVWCDEPNVRLDLLAQVALATPHIAGYSLQAKQRASFMLLDKFKQHLDSKATTSSAAEDSEPLCLPVDKLDNVDHQDNRVSRTWENYAKAFAIEQLSVRLKESGSRGNLKNDFDQMRREVLACRSEL